MPSPSLTYVNRIQNKTRNGPPATSFFGYLDEFLRTMFVRVMQGIGEEIRFSANASGFNFGTVAGFTASGATPTEGTVDNQSLDFTFKRITSQSAVDVILQRSNTQPNSVLRDDERFRRAAILRVMSDAIVNGDGTTQWLGYNAAGFPRTDVVVPPLVTPGSVLDTLKLINDEVTTHALGSRATCYITNPLGRRNIEAAAESLGLTLPTVRCPGLTAPVPTYRGTKILVTETLTGAPPDRAYVFAVDETQGFFLATSGTPVSRGIASLPMPYQDSGSVGRLQYVHGAMVAMTERAFVRSDITTTLTQV